MPQNNSKQQNKICREAGNVFIIILLGVALFGALMFAFSRSANQGTGNITKQQANVAAQEILNYARLVEGAVNRVRRNGCSETEISFDNAVVSGYSNPGAPIDNSCHIFEDEGGKISYLSPQTTWLDSSFSGSTSFGNSVITGDLKISNVGTSALDLLFYIPYVSDPICKEINSHAQIPTSTIPVETFGGGTGLFTGSFNTATTPIIGDEATELSSKTYLCTEQTSNNANFAMFVLLAR